MIQINTGAVPLTANMISSMSKDLGFSVPTVTIYNGIVGVDTEEKAEKVISWLHRHGYRAAKKIEQKV